jgi:hypothetical protein
MSQFSDEQVEAALWAFDNCQKGRVAAMRAALEAAAQAAPAPTAAPGEYDELCERLERYDNGHPLCEHRLKAAAAIRKLTAERDALRAALAKE